MTMLDYYFSILAGEEKARFINSKAISLRCQNINQLSLSELWKIHDAAIKNINEFEEISGQELSLLGLKKIIVDKLLQECCLCERRCGIDRIAGQTGVCGVGLNSRYSTDFLHMGEEAELVPSHTIFFSGCTFSCVYCQNWDIAMHPDTGKIVEPEFLVRSIVELNKQGSKNINFVGGNPDPHLRTVLLILEKLDLNIPIVWNSNMYASIETMRILAGLSDIYLGDFRYGNNECAKKYSKIDNYMQVVSRNFIEADKQAEIMLRHLVLPGHLDCCTRPIMEWVSKNIPDVYFNLMFQYRPSYRASEYPEINRILSEDERRMAINLAKEYEINF